MEVVVLPGPDEVARAAARRVAEAVRRSPDAVGLATGSSPLGLYAELARQVATGELDVSGVRGFAPEHPQSNEPASSLSSRTRVETLAPASERTTPASPAHPRQCRCTA